MIIEKSDIKQSECTMRKYYLLSTLWVILAFITLSCPVSAQCQDPGTFNINVFVGYHPPEISDIPDQTILEDTTSSPIPFTITDKDNDINELSLIALSTNQTLIPGDNISFSGSGNNRFVTISPAANEFGSLSVTIVVNDGRDFSSQSFLVTILPVNDPPIISFIPDQWIIQDTSTNALPITISDSDSNQLTIWVESSDLKIVPPETAHLKLIGINPDGHIFIPPGDVHPLSLTVIPAKTEYGALSITVFAKDAMQAVMKRDFTLHISQAEYLITTAVTGNGAITPVNPIVKKYEQVVIRMKPDPGYMVKDIIVDGISKGPMPRYIAYGVNPPKSLTAVFGLPEQYEITTITNTGGTIHPSGPISVEEHKNQLFQINTDFGYVLVDVLVDNQSMGPVVLHEFTNVIGTHTIQARFRQASPPIADFSSNIDNGFSPLKIQFADQSYITDDTAGDEVTGWLWDFGDGTSKSTGKNPIHYYTREGDYTVTLTATGTGGITSTKVKSQFITVLPSTVYVNFSADKTVINKGDSIQFNVQSNIPTGATFLWNFGDGTGSTIKNPTKIYQNAGQYTVQLTFTVADNDYVKEKTQYIKVSGRTISGQVRAGDILGNDTGNPLSSYWVEVWHTGTQPVAYTTSDNNGFYTITGLSADSGFIVSVYPPFGTNDYFEQYFNGKSSRSTANKINLIDQDRNDIHFVLKQVPQYGISGTIHNGVSGLSDIEVTVFSEDTNCSAMTLTDENGKYTLTGLKMASDYKIFVYYDYAEYYYAIPDHQTFGDYIPVCGDTVSRWDLSSTVMPSMSPVTGNIDLVLCQFGAINGHVYNDDNHPLQHIWVNARSNLLNVDNGALTDETGEYTITGLTIVSEAEVLTKGYYVEITDHNYPYQVYPEKTSINSATAVSANSSTDIDFRLKQTAHIYGKVTDIYNNPVPDVQVTAWSKAFPANKQGSAFSNSEGDYTITELPFARDYIVAAFPTYFPDQYYNQKTKEDMDEATIVSLEYGNVYDINFILDEGAVIKGTVKISENNIIRAAQNIWVDIHSQSQPDKGGQVMTDQNGNYELTGLDETILDYVIKVKLSGYQPAYYHPERPDTTVYLWSDAVGVEPSTTLDRNLLIVKGFSIKGRVSFENQSVKGLQVIAYSQNGGNGSAITTQNDDDNYEIIGLPNGLYTVFVTSNRYADASIENLVINGENIFHIDFDLELPERQISGIVHELAANKVIKLLVFSIDGDDSKIIELLGDGNPMPYTIYALKPFSDYKMQLYSNDYPDQIYNDKVSINDADIIDLSLASASGVDFTLNSDVSMIKGNVTFPSSASTGDTAWVDVQSESTGSQGGAEVKKIVNTTQPVSDEYTITGLKRANDYLVHVWSDKYLTQYYLNADTKEEAQLINTTLTYETNNINFTLDPGKTIYGKIVDEYRNALSNIYVEASSDSSDSVRGAMSSFDGQFAVKGLRSANDYKLKAVKPGVDLPFFYNTSQTVRERSLASSLSTMDGDLNQIEIILSEGLSIAGTVRDSLRNPILNAKIWVNISSETKKIDVGNYIDMDGSYSISGLPSGKDYQVAARPSSDSPYLPSTITNVESGQSNVDFYLNTGSKIDGFVFTNTGSPLRNVRINISSAQSSVSKWIKTKSSGYYSIDGLPDASDYAIVATPPESSDYVEFSEFGLVIDSDTVKDITLLPAMRFVGYVYQSDGQTPVKNAWVSAFSQSSENFMKGDRTDANGYFEINNLPDASDYVMTVQADGYLSQKMTDQSPGGSDLVFNIESGGSITGSVKNTSGQPISGARVKVESILVSTVTVIETGSNGKFELKGLKTTDTFGNIISNYQVTVEAKGYQPQKKVQLKVGDNADFTMSSGGTISGTIKDANENTPPVNYKISIIVFEKLDNGKLKLPPIKTNPDSDGQFIVKGLTIGVPYLIQITSTIRGNLISKIQWVGENNEGVRAFNGTGPDELGPAIELTPDTVIDFKFRGTF
jgi:PKD repeat protein